VERFIHIHFAAPPYAAGTVIVVRVCEGRVKLKSYFSAFVE